MLPAEFEYEFPLPHLGNRRGTCLFTRASAWTALSAAPSRLVAPYLPQPRQDKACARGEDNGSKKKGRLVRLTPCNWEIFCCTLSPKPEPERLGRRCIGSCCLLWSKLNSRPGDPWRFASSDLHYTLAEDEALVEQNIPVSPGIASEGSQCIEPSPHFLSTTIDRQAISPNSLAMASSSFSPVPLCTHTDPLSLAAHLVCRQWSNNKN